MTLYDIYIIVRDNMGMGAVGLIILATFLEHSKTIKINPFSLIGGLFNKELKETVTMQSEKLNEQSKQLDALSVKISNVQTEVNENAAMSSRYRILRFDDEIRHGTLHTKEHYDQIIVDIDIYESFCDRNPDFKNNLAKKAIGNIKRMYDVRNDDNSFL